MRTKDDLETTVYRGVRPGLASKRVQSAHPLHRPAEQSYSFARSTRKFDCALDLPPSSPPVSMKTGTLDVGSVAFVHGESLGGGLPCRSQALEAENDSTFFGRASSRLASDYQRQMYHMRFTQSTPSSPIRSVSSRAKISNTNNNIEESGSPASPSRRRLASATRRLGGATSSVWIDMSPGSSSNLWAKARPSTAGGLRSTMVPGFAVTGYSQRVHGLPCNSPGAIGVQLLAGGNGCKKPDELHTSQCRWKSANNLGASYRKRLPTERPPRLLSVTLDS